MYALMFLLSLVVLPGQGPGVEGEGAGSAWLSFVPWGNSTTSQDGVPQVPNTASPSAIAALRSLPLGQLKKVISPKRAAFLWISCLSLQLG